MAGMTSSDHARDLGETSTRSAGESWSDRDQVRLVGVRHRDADRREGKAGVDRPHRAEIVSEGLIKTRRAQHGAK